MRMKTTNRRVMTRAAIVGALLGGLALRGRGLRRAAGAWSASARGLKGLKTMKGGMVGQEMKRGRLIAMGLYRKARRTRNLLRGVGAGGSLYAGAPLARRKRP